MIISGLLRGTKKARPMARAKVILGFKGCLSSGLSPSLPGYYFG